jgi:hypothetical protein
VFSISSTQISPPSTVASEALPSPSASLVISAKGQKGNSNKKDDHSKTSAQSQSPAGAIAGGVIGGVILLALVACVILWFRRRRRSRTAPSAEFLTVFPPDTPFSRVGSVGHTSQFTEKRNDSYAA